MVGGVRDRHGVLLFLGCPSTLWPVRASEVPCSLSAVLFAEGERHHAE
jgi:hypothetical protein